MSQGSNYAFSTPQNTPANNAPISSRAQQPGLASLSEGMARFHLNISTPADLGHDPEGALDQAAAASIFAKNPLLVNMIQNKLSGLVGQSSGYIESLPANVRRRVAGLKGVQKEHSKLEAQFQEEVLALEKKYFTKYTPLYEKRSAIINGKAEPSDQEIKEGESMGEDEDGEEKKISTEAKEDEDDTPVSGIPEFWLSAMKNQPSLAEMITPEDELALKHLVDIRMEYLEKPGFRLTFDFADNDFFTNKSLQKAYYYQEESGYAGEYIYDHATGDKIEWKANKDLTVKVEQKKQRNKSPCLPLPTPRAPPATNPIPDTKQTRIVKKTVPCDSFFNFFSPPKPPQDEEDDDVASDIEERLELDYTLGEDIKEKLIPRAIDWFTGEALQFEQLGEDLEGDFEDDDDEDEDDLSDDREDEDDTEEEVRHLATHASDDSQR